MYSYYRLQDINPLESFILLVFLLKESSRKSFCSFNRLGISHRFAIYDEESKPPERRSSRTGHLLLCFLNFQSLTTNEIYTSLYLRICFVVSFSLIRVCECRWQKSFK